MMKEDLLPARARLLAELADIDSQLAKHGLLHVVNQPEVKVEQVVEKPVKPMHLELPVGGDIVVITEAKPVVKKPVVKPAPKKRGRPAGFSPKKKLKSKKK